MKNTLGVFRMDYDELLAEMAAHERFRNEMRVRRERVATANPVDLARSYLRYREESQRRRAAIDADSNGFLFVYWALKDFHIAEQALQEWLVGGYTAHPPWTCGRLLTVGEEARQIVEKALEGAGFTLARPKLIECSICYPDGNWKHREDAPCPAFEDKDALLIVLAKALVSR
jgi:hypothetical protein